MYCWGNWFTRHSDLYYLYHVDILYICQRDFRQNDYKRLHSGTYFCCLEYTRSTVKYFVFLMRYSVTVITINSPHHLYIFFHVGSATSPATPLPTLRLLLNWHWIVKILLCFTHFNESRESLMPFKSWSGGTCLMTLLERSSTRNCRKGANSSYGM